MERWDEAGLWMGCGGCLILREINFHFVGEKLAEGVGSGCRLNQAKLLMHGLR